MGDTSHGSIVPDQAPHTENNGDRVTTAEPVRTRWTPKPEQILILESIFNSGMVNPPKDETVRIRKLLEKFGAVGDANVFYWFQNRRSRSRRRQRQMQAGMAAAYPRFVGLAASSQPCSATAGAIPCNPAVTLACPSSTSSSCKTSSGCGGGYSVGGTGDFFSTSSVAGPDGCFSSGSSLLGHDGADDLFTISRQMGFRELEEPNPLLTSDLQYQSAASTIAGPITVFINGVLSEVPRGPIDVRAMFGKDVILVDSSGDVVPATENGVLFQGLQMGESYFLVTKPTL